MQSKSTHVNDYHDGITAEILFKTVITGNLLLGNSLSYTHEVGPCCEHYCRGCPSTNCSTSCDQDFNCWRYTTNKDRTKCYAKGLDSSTYIQVAPVGTFPAKTCANRKFLFQEDCTCLGTFQECAKTFGYKAFCSKTTTKVSGCKISTKPFFRGSIASIKHYNQSLDQYYLNEDNPDNFFSQSAHMSWRRPSSAKSCVVQ